MTSPLSDFVMLTFINEGDAPPEAAAFAGTTFLLPPEYLTAIGSGSSSIGYIPNGSVKVRGWHRVETNGSHSWVMTSELSAAQRTAILAVPVGGWVDQTLTTGTPLRIAHNVARALRQNTTLAGADILDVLTKLVRAGASNRDAQIAGGG